MSYQNSGQYAGGNAQQRPFSFQIPAENPNTYTQHPPQHPAHTGVHPATQPTQATSEGWSGYPQQRFSYVDTPIDDNTQTFDDERQAALLEEARARYGDGQSSAAHPMQQQHPQHQAPLVSQSQYPQEKQQVTRMPSAYQLPPPAEPHPAQFAPYAEPTTPAPAAVVPEPPQQNIPPQQHYATPPPVSPGPLPLKTEDDFRQSARMSPPPMSPPPKQSNPGLTSPQFAPPPTSASPFSPYAGTGPDLETQHRPGQIPHPNMKHSKTGNGSIPQVSSINHFHHGLCACPGSDLSTCMTGLFCPCILYSRLTYRLGQRSRKQDPTDILGFHKCNGHCFAFAALCACGVSGILAAITRGRVRHAYDVEGSAGLDCIEGCCCCCCTVIQSEREVRKREEERTRWAGPSTGVDLEPYKRVESMRYSSATGH